MATGTDDRLRLNVPERRHSPRRREAIDTDPRGQLTKGTRDAVTMSERELQLVVLARLDERASIAMDLHDHTIQALHGAVFWLAAAERAADTDVERMRTALRQVRDQLNSTIQELRTYVRQLRPCGPSQSGLRAGITAVADRIRLNLDVRVELEMDERVESVIHDPGVVEQFVAIAQEASSNAVRHGNARSVTIRVYRESGRVTLFVSDDGRGFDKRAARRTAGQGLANMSERARLLGGRLSIVSRPGSGTQLSVDCPVRDELIAR
jgi:signal transduction histidine kinase